MKNLKNILMLSACVMMASLQPALAKNNLSRFAYADICKKTPKQEVADALDSWIAAVGGESREALEKLYADEAVIVPTVSAKIIVSPEQRKEYFDTFLAHPRTKIKVKESHIRTDGDWAVNTGVYLFSYKDKGKKINIPARFSFTYKKSWGGWKIVDHHSSRMPK